MSSLVNLVNNLNDRFQFFVFCDAYEIGETHPLNNIKVDAWNDYGNFVKVFYASKRSIQLMKQALSFSNPDSVYINGIFLPYYTLLAIHLSKKLNRQIVLAPRGMLQKAALAIKPSKKKVFLAAFKLFGFQSGIKWHATDAQEQQDIQKSFGSSANITIAPNIPKKPLTVLTDKVKQSGSLKLIYLSLITEKKNLHLVLEALKKVGQRVQFDIYGPIQDVQYWQRCQQLMLRQDHDINYLGVLSPDEVQKKIMDYHFFVLPTGGENFGHAIYEAFSVGTPCIISEFTPWANLADTNAGITVSLDTEEIATTIKKVMAMSQEQYDKLSNGAFALSQTYYGQNDFKSFYVELFK